MNISSALDQTIYQSVGNERLAGGKGLSQRKFQDDETETNVEKLQKRINAGESYERELSLQEKRKLAELKRNDREIRQHEQTHRALAGPYARGSIQFKYEMGPDGKRYVTGGEVNIDSSKIAGDPDATAKKMEAVKRAALAPTDPSPKDRFAAMMATRMQARAEAKANEKADNKADIEEKSEREQQGFSPQFNQAVAKFQTARVTEQVSNLFDLFA